MANTLTQCKTLSTEELQPFIIETIVKESPLLRYMLWQTLNGSAYAYNLESVAAGAGFYTIGDTWSESTPEWTKRTVALTELGGDADVPDFARQTLSNVQDLKASIISLKVKAIAHEFERCAIYGGTTLQVDTNEFKGLLQLIAEIESPTTTDLDGGVNTQVVPLHATSATIDVDSIDQLVDAVKPGKPDILLTSKRMLRKITSLARASGLVIGTGIDSIGFPVTMWGTIPLLGSDFIEDNLPNNDGSSVVDISAYDWTKTRAANYDNTPIFALTFGDDALLGLQGSNGIETKDVGTLESKNAERTRVLWYVSMALLTATKVAVMTGATDGT